MTAGTLHRGVLSLTMATTVLWTVYAIWDGLRQTTRIERALGLPFAVWLTGMSLLAILQCWSAVATWRSEPSSGRATSWGLSTAVVFWLGYLWLGQPLDLFQLETAVSAAGGVFALCLLQSKRLDKLADLQWVRRIHIVLFNVCLTAVLLEIALGIVAWISPRPELMCRDSYVQSRLSGYAFPKGYIHRGFACNQLGHYDQEFLPKAERKKTTVLMIGDSFSAGVVPHHYHFTTVGERVLSDVDIYNMGISGIGPEEYLYLLSYEGLQLKPDAVVVNIYLGNDLVNTRTGTGISHYLKLWFDRGNVRIWFLPERLLLVAAERKRARADIFASDPQRVVKGEAEILAAFPSVKDHRREKATLSKEQYLKITRHLIESSCPPHPDRLKPMLEHLATMRQLCRDIPFGVMLIPAEYQVEDALWKTATSQLTGGPYQKDAAQAKVSQWLEAEGIPYLDLLPILRAVEPFPDGDRHCYCRQDTHFNVRGNQVVGESLAPFLRKLLR
ncbi:MAG: hypothetical protein VX951_03230 [Planctomycetota bacterium]|nr:hypothetical protein [Planctomycetota bacterium]